MKHLDLGEAPTNVQHMANGTTLTATTALKNRAGEIRNYFN